MGEKPIIPDKLIGWGDILRGVGEIIVDEAKLLLHALTDHIRHPNPSEHFKDD